MKQKIFFRLNPRRESLAQNSRPSIHENKLFMLGNSPRTIELPHLLETGEFLSTDGRWVKITSEKGQTFYRTRQCFTIAHQSFYVGQSLPFIYRHHKVLKTSACIGTALLSLALVSQVFVWSGSASSVLQTFPENHPGIRTKSPKTESEQKEPQVLTESRAPRPIQSSSVPSPQKDASATDTGEVDPIRCSPIAHIAEHKPDPFTKGTSHSSDRRWYVCR